jgi:hypothetical protein
MSLNTGDSKFNVSYGDNYIYNGSLGVDGQIQIGTGINYYSLPAQQGNVDDVLTLTSSNVADWAPPQAGFSGKIAKTQYVMLQPRNSGFGTSATIDLTGQGSKSIDLTQFPIGSSLHVVARGRVDNSIGIGTVNGGWALDLNAAEPSFYRYTYSQYGNTPTLPNTTQANFFEVEYVFTRTADEDWYVSGWGATSQGGTIGGFDATRVDFTFTPTAFTQNFGTSITFDITFQDFSLSGGFMNSNAKVYYAETFVDVQALVGETTTNDHLLLTNLNGGTDGDAGHTNMTMLSGRAGGQEIIGGTQAGDNLTLKSNSVTPLINHVQLASALDTKFHRIFSSNPATPLVIEHDSILDAIKFKISGNDKLDIRDGEIRLYDPLFVGTNAISEVNEITSADLQSLILRTFNGGNAIIIEDSGNIILNRTLNANTFTLDNVGNINLRSLSAADKEIKNTDTLGNLVIDNLSSGELQLKHSGIEHLVISGNPETFFRNAPVVFESSASAVSFNFNSLSSSIDNNSNYFQSDGDFSVESPIVSLGSSTALGLLLSGPLATDDVEVHRPTNFLNNSIVNVSTINGIQPSGGIFAGTSPSVVVSATTLEVSILPSTFVGSNQVPANGFKVGDSFHLVLAGDFGSQQGDTVTIRLKGGSPTPVVLATLVVPLQSSSGVSFEIEVDFQLRQIGGAGVADICSNFDFTYNGGAGNAFRGERGVFQNNTTFDTTTANVLDVTAQFSSNNANNTIQTQVSKLTKTY